MFKSDEPRSARLHEIRTYGMPAMLNFMFHLIARIDDPTQVLIENVKEHNIFSSNCLKTRLNWSKNVQEERDAPWQMVIGRFPFRHNVIREFRGQQLWFGENQTRNIPSDEDKRLFATAERNFYILVCFGGTRLFDTERTTVSDDPKQHDKSRRSISTTENSFTVPSEKLPPYMTQYDHEE